MHTPHNDPMNTVQLKVQPLSSAEATSANAQLIFQEFLASRQKLEKRWDAHNTYRNQSLSFEEALTNLLVDHAYFPQIPRPILVKHIISSTHALEEALRVREAQLL